MDHTQVSSVVKCFQCDLCEEYKYNLFVELLKSNGTIRQSCCTNVAEPKHRHIMVTSHSLLLSAHILSKFWEKPFLPLLYLIKSIP